MRSRERPVPGARTRLKRLGAGGGLPSTCLRAVVKIGMPHPPDPGALSSAYTFRALPMLRECLPAFGVKLACCTNRLRDGDSSLLLSTLGSGSGLDPGQESVPDQSAFRSMHAPLATARPKVTPSRSAIKHQAQRRVCTE